MKNVFYGGAMKIDTVLNRDELLDRVGGDIKFLEELIDIFVECYPRLLQKIDRAIQIKDSEALENAAHELKGVVGNFCAPGAVIAAHNMQIHGKNADFAASPADYIKLVNILGMVELALKNLVEEHTPPNS